MSIADVETHDENLEELLERLGQVPLARILLRPPPGMATEADVIAAEARPRKRLCELIDGVLVEKVMGFVESLIAVFLSTRVNAFVLEHNLGVVSGEAGMLRLWPGRVRIPDVAFISWDRLPGRCVPTAPIPDIGPDLAVEVLSASNTRAEMEQKRRDYFGAGALQVWEVDPSSRTVAVYTGPNTACVLTTADVLSGDEILPGFELPVRDLFAQLAPK